MKMLVIHPSNCAERTAFFKAVSEGVLEFDAICVVGGMNKVLKEYAAPCGVCRQVMMEFCDPDDISDHSGNQSKISMRSSR